MNREEREEREEDGRLAIEWIASDVVHSAVKIHRSLGPGLLESTYQRCLEYELRRAGHKVACEVVVPIWYEGISINAGYRMDMLIGDRIVIENKTVEFLLPIHYAQLLTYLKLQDLRLGFLINWNVKIIKHGIHRYVNGL